MGLSDRGRARESLSGGWHGLSAMGGLVRFLVPDMACPDRFRAALERPPRLATDGREVAVLPWPVDPLLALRLVEGGVHRAAPAGSFAYFDLGERTALRRRLRFRHDGDVHAFLQLARALPDSWWLRIEDERLEDPLAGEIERICRYAVDIAGMHSLSTAHDELPSPRVVRAVVRRLWGAATPIPSASLAP